MRIGIRPFLTIVCSLLLGSCARAYIGFSYAKVRKTTWAPLVVQAHGFA